jgi:hypothetical protein
MPVTVRKRKKVPAAVALGCKGGKKGGLARAAKLTQAQRSESARKAVQARWAKTKAKRSADSAAARSGASDHAFMSLLKRYKATNGPIEMESLSE